MRVKKNLISALIAVLFVFGVAGSAIAALGPSELDTEKIAVTFAAEVERGNYKVVATQELKNGLMKETHAHRRYHAFERES